MNCKTLVLALLVGVATAAQAQTPPNPFARPAPAPVATPPAPATVPNLPPLPLPPAVPPGPQVTEESVEATRVGTVNGIHIYRGRDGYVFETESDRKIVRKLAPAPSPLSGLAEPSPLPSGPNHRTLPSSVGRPAPRN